MHELDGNNLLESVSRAFSIEILVQPEELITRMVDLSEYRARLNVLYDYKGLPLLQAARNLVGQYLVVSESLKIQKKLFNPTWYSMRTLLIECGYLFFNKDIEDTLEEWTFPEIKIEDFLTLILLELATADHATQLEQPWILIKPLKEAPYNLIIPSMYGLALHEKTIKQLLNGSRSMNEWLSQIRKDFMNKVKSRS